MSTDVKTSEQNETDEVSESRVRTLTEKGTTLYREQQQKHLDQLTHLWVIVDSFVQETNQPQADVSSAQNLERKLLPAYEKYRRQSDIYVEYLQSQRTDQSTGDLKAHLALADLNRRVYEEAIAKLQDIANELASQRSRRSKQQKSSSRRSRDSVSKYSNTTNTSKQQRAKADAARVKVDFAEKQAQILKEEAELKERIERKEAQAKLEQTAIEQQAKLKQAEIEQRQKEEAASATRKQTELKVEFDLLETKQEAASAEAAARALEDDDNDDDSQDLGSQLPDQTVDPIDRVKDFINQSSLENPEETEDMRIQTRGTPAMSIQIPDIKEPHASLEANINPTSTNPPNTSKTPVLGDEHHEILKSSSFSQSRKGLSLGSCFNEPATTLDVPRSTIQPKLAKELKTRVSSFENDKRNDKDESVVTRLLLQREALSTGLTKFKDTPESYIGWKSSFQATMEESNVSARKQLEQFVKWLGPESVHHAVSIQTCSSDDPSEGVKELWKRLDGLYGAPEMLEASIKRKLDNFSRLTNKDTKRFYDLYNILMEIQFLKKNPKFRSLLAYYDSSSGLKPIVGKLPYGLQEKWCTRALNYKTKHDVAFPPFTEFCVFIAELCKLKNDPSLALDYEHMPQKPVVPKQRFPDRLNVHSRKTELDQGSKSKMEHFQNQSQNNLSQPEQPIREDVSHCIIHKSKHSLNDCRGFRAKSLEERKKLLKENNVCYRCCASTSHFGRECPTRIKCKDCGSESHPTALHVDKPNKKVVSSSENSPNKHGGEQRISCESTTAETVSNTCTEICSNAYNGKSCAKILPVKVYHKDKPDKVMKMYAIIDEQSNRSLASSEFFNSFDIQATPVNYTLSTCSGKVLTSGQQGNDFIISSVNDEVQFNLPPLIECDNIPDNRDEIPTPDVVQYHSHLADLASFIQPIDENCKIMLLIGRDLPEAHHICDQRTDPENYNAPYAHQLKLGWVIIGETCLDKLHTSTNLSVKRTFVTPDGQHTMFKPCTNQFELHEQFFDTVKSLYVRDQKDNLGVNLFEKTKDDDKPGMSQEDKQFLNIMSKEFKRNATGNWVAPLPFKVPRMPLPDNRPQAIRRAKLLDASLQKNSVKRKHFLEFMQKILDNKHAEVAPPLQDNEERWYLPLFGVYHPRKPDQIRGVFDSSAKHDGISLNSVLLTGPDLSNSLLGVLLRFRREMVAVTADVQHMFHCFIVEEKHRNFLRFFWHKDNDLEEDLIEYRMRVHVFGNSPSPSVATLGLRRTVQAAEHKYGSHVSEFVNKDFYVDDGLTSYPTTEDAIKVVKDTQSALKEFGNLRLHKFASNSSEVLAAFPTSDLAPNMKDLDLEADDKPLQRSLGLCWDVNTDKFLFQLSSDNKPITRRGILSTINSIYDPIGFLAPVIIHGKLLLRELISETVDWDQPVSDKVKHEWETWRNTLKEIENLRIPRTCVTYLSKAVTKELHVFSDASEKAIAAVVYLRTTYPDGKTEIGFVLGKAKLAPSSGHTIPRKELCAAVLGIEIAQCAIENLNITIDTVHYYTDSKVVLGYICNETKRFYIYVANRVDKIRKFSEPNQWNYVHTYANPADAGTRSIPAHEIHDSAWLLGPTEILANKKIQNNETYELIEPETDQDIRTTYVNVLKTATTPGERTINTERFKRFSSWTRLVKAIAFLKRFIRSFLERKKMVGSDVNVLEDAEVKIIKTVQSEVFGEEIECLQSNTRISKQSRIFKLNPFLDERGLLRVGGRIVNSEVSFQEKKPVIIPGRHHIATLIIAHYHEKIKHQGRHFTEGAVRGAGFWIIGAKRQISTIIFKCVSCRKLRGKMECQIMSNLPEDRLQPFPPFTNVGVDVFGPWTIITRKTRGGSANSKRWAVLFTCLVTRAVHIEVVHEMSSSSFILALNRFTAIRGEVKIFRSDRGTNFVGAMDDLKMDVINVEDEKMRKHLHGSRAVWLFNPPKSSHMGGVWERMIGVARRILESMLANTKTLTDEILATFMAEVSAIINSRPLIPVSTDPEAPLILTPTMLLTQKTDYQFISDHFGNFTEQDMYREEWKRVQALSSLFWTRWRKEYLPLLQQRRKWTDVRRDLEEGDVVLLKDKTICRNQWPLGIVVNAIKGSDKHVRKAEVRVISNGKPTVYTRPIAEMILLVERSCLK